MFKALYKARTIGVFFSEKGNVEEMKNLHLAVVTCVMHLLRPMLSSSWSFSVLTLEEAWDAASFTFPSSQEI
jgi:hypothetical protein